MIGVLTMNKERDNILIESTLKGNINSFEELMRYIRESCSISLEDDLLPGGRRGNYPGSIYKGI